VFRFGRLKSFDEVTDIPDWNRDGCGIGLVVPSLWVLDGDRYTVIVIRHSGVADVVSHSTPRSESGASPMGRDDGRIADFDLCSTRGLGKSIDHHRIFDQFSWCSWWNWFVPHPGLDPLLIAGLIATIADMDDTTLASSGVNLVSMDTSVSDSFPLP